VFDFINSNIQILMTTIALFNNSNSAQHVYDKLIAAGIDKKHISVAAREPKDTNLDKDINVQKDSHIVEDATGGTTTGAVAGAAIGFLTGAAALTLPGFGGLLVAGPLAAALGGSSLAANTALGATIGGVGGLVSGLVKAGVDETQAQYIESSLQQGGVIIAVKDDNAGNYKSILAESDSESIIDIDN
jgi:hypothetical protein